MRSSALLLLLSLPAFSQAPRYASKLSPFVASPTRVVELMLEMAKIKPGETVYDLGSGDGRIVIAAAGKYKANAIGVEISPKLVASTTADIERAGLTEQARIIQGDVFTFDFTGADVVTMYLDSQSNARLKPRLEKFLKPGARVVSHDYAVPGWKATRVEKTDGRQEHTIYLYEIRSAK
jgi:cyclopropane fatty-acyl-phospholipid synthase-like methyltransferase